MGSRRPRQIGLIDSSPLRRIDPRTKILISLAASFVVMMPFERLVVFLGIYALFLLWARLFIPVIRQIWRIKWLLILLFVVDWWLINLDHAILVCTRLMLLTGTFTLFFSTTTTHELSLGLARLRVPYRYAFSLGLAFQSIGLLEDEWIAVKEAQRSRGAIRRVPTFKRFVTQISDFIALTVPAIVLTTKRAWTITESAYVRGFDSPKRNSYYVLSPGWLDYLLVLGTIIVVVSLVWRW
jgi:energy-coupling factor transporter transmembrane protein EcfT